MSEQKVKSGEMKRLVFSRNADDSKEKPEDGKLDFTVMINPESISRSLSMKVTDNNSSKSESKGDAYDCNPESISFTFYLDRTNVVPPTNTRHDGQSVDEMINEFLKVVYKTDKGQPVQSLAIKYGEGLQWTVRTETLTIDHTLFNREGETLRAKISCSFKTIVDGKPKRKKPKPNPKPTPTPTPPVQPSTPESSEVSSHDNCNCNCSEFCSGARQDNKDSLYTPVKANFSTNEGYAIKV